MSRNLLMGIVFFAGLLIAFFLTWPSFQEYQELSYQAAEKERELENEETYLRDLAGVKAKLHENQESVAKVRAAIPATPELPALYDFWQQAASFSGMSVRNITAVSEGKNAPLSLRTIPVTLELTGSWGSVKELMSRLTLASRIAVLQSLSVSGGPDQGRFNVTVQLTSFSY